MSVYSYGDVSMRESLWDTIKDLNPLETYFTSNARKVKVSNKVHSWLEDPIASITTSAGTAELADTSYAGTNPTLRSNHTQIIERGYKVPMTDENADHAGFDSRVARERMKKMLEWKETFEIGATVGTLVSGTGTAARSMQGFVRFASTLVTGHSGVSLTSDMLNDFLKNAWEAGDKHDTLLVGALLKRRISAFTESNTKNVEAEDGVIVGRVDVYDSDFGRVDIVLHRHINKAAANTYNVLATYIKDYTFIGELDAPHFEDRAKTGYFEAGSIVGEVTAGIANEKAAQLIRGLL